MVERFLRAKDNKVDSKSTPASEPVRTVSDDYRAAVKQTIENEVGALIQEEIRAAARELVEEQRKAIREAVQQHKQIIQEVVEEEKVAIRAKIEDLRRAITTLGVG